MTRYSLNASPLPSFLARTIAQAGHGLVVGDIVRLNGSDTYTKAQANSAANAEVVGVVSAVADVNNFTLALPGSYTTVFAGALVANTIYFLDPTTAGARTATEPSTVGQVSKPVLYAATTSGAYIMGMRGIVVVATAAAAASAMVKLEEVVLGAPAATVTFSAIAQTYRTLRLIYQARGSTAAVGQTIQFTLNNDGGANYDRNLLVGGNGAASNSIAFAGTSILFAYIPAANGTAGNSGSGTIDLPNYAGTTFNKTANIAAGAFNTNIAADSNVYAAFGQWRSTAAINRIDISATADNFVTGSTFTLYGIN